MRELECADLVGRERHIDTAATAIRRGRIAAVPDEGMYSLIGDAFSVGAVERIRQIKGRSTAPLTVLVGKPGTVDGVAFGIPAYARDLMAALWPGPLTLILRQQPSLAWPLTAPGISVRMPLHPLLLAVVREVGPTATTAANIAGLDPARTPEQIAEQVGDDVDLFLSVGEIPSAERSTIVDATGDVPVILRPGAYDADRIAAVCPALEIRPA